MDKKEALWAYIGAVLPERERYLTQRARKQFRGSGDEDDPKTVQAFENTLYHIRRADKVYRKLQQGELVLEYYQEEFASSAAVFR